MIKTTVAKLINAQEVLQKIVDTELPARECWKALRVLREIEKEANTITNTRRELCKKYAELDEQGNFKPDENGNYIIKDNCEEAFVKQMTLRQKNWKLILMALIGTCWKELISRRQN